MKISGFGLIRLSKMSQDHAKVANHKAHIDLSNYYMAPEVYKDDIFDRGVDVHSFGVILYELTERVPVFHPRPPEEVVKMICLEGKRPVFKSKSRTPQELKDLIDECWHPEVRNRPTFFEIIIRLEKIVASCSKQGWWKDTFKFSWR